MQYLHNLNRIEYIKNKYTLEKIYLVNIWLDRVNQCFFAFFLQLYVYVPANSDFCQAFCPEI